MAENEKNFLIVDTDEAGQVIGMRRMEAGDTISNDRLNTDIRDAGSNATLALETANNAQLSATAAQGTANDVAASTVNLSGYITDNQGTWGAGGIDPTDLANLKDASNAIADFSGASGTFASSNRGTGVIVDADIADDAALSGGKIASGTITDTQIAMNANIDGSKLANYSISNDQLEDGVALVNIGPGGMPSTALSAGAAVANIGADGITSNEIGPSAVTAAKINANAITADKIVDNTITNSEISTGAEIAVSKLQNITGPVILGKTTDGDGNITTISKTDAKAFVDVDDLEASSNFPVTTLNNNLDANGNEINGLTAIKGTTTTVLTLSGKEPLLIGTDGIKFGIGNPSYPQLSSLTTVITELAAASATPVGGGSAVASAIAVGNGSSVIVSGADDDSIPVEDPQNGAVMIIDTAAARIKFRRINATNIDPAAGITNSQLAGGIESSKLAAGAAAGNISAGQANSIAFVSLPQVSANSFVGQSHPTIGGTMGQISNTTARNMLGLSAGTVAPTSPSAGDLWYNTDDDELYTYDSGRGHWLGAPHYISMGKTTSTGAGVGHFLYVGHQGTAATTQERGWLVPHDMVITGWRAHTKSTFTGWTVRIDKNDGQGTNTEGIVSTGALGAVDTFSDFTLDVDVTAGEILGVACVNGTSTIDNSTVTIKIQRKGA